MLTVRLLIATLRVPPNLFIKHSTSIAHLGSNFELHLGSRSGRCESRLFSASSTLSKTKRGVRKIPEPTTSKPNTPRIETSEPIVKTPESLIEYWKHERQEYKKAMKGGSQTARDNYRKAFFQRARESGGLGGHTAMIITVIIMYAGIMYVAQADPWNERKPLGFEELKGGGSVVLLWYWEENINA